MSHSKNIDPTASSRKEDHIKLAFESAVSSALQDNRFYYEPMLSGHPNEKEDFSVSIAGKRMKFPIWISSMTGGTARAAKININLAKACEKFGLGMGLGSCRQLLSNRDRFDEFDIRHLMPSAPLFANLGIAQLETMLADNTLQKLDKLIDDLKADGLIIHINPLQEWMQPEGDKIKQSPIVSIESLLEKVSYPIIVKEVGQGMGPKSLETLLKLPIEAIEFGAHGGTNFSKLELLRANKTQLEAFKSVANIGHSPNEMVQFCNEIIKSNKEYIQCKHIIVSGGIKDFLDGFYFTENVNHSSIYAQGSAMLRFALEGEEALFEYIEMQIEGYKMAKALLSPKAIK